MMTKIFTYMNFYTVNMNYLWNDIYTYYVEWYIPTVLSSSKQTVSGHSCVCSSTCTYQYTNYCNSNQKFYFQYPKWQISAYWDIGSNIIYVMMKHINQFILWSWKSTMKYNDMNNNFYTYEFFNDKWHNDLQQFSIDKWIDISYKIYLPYFDMQHHLLFLLCHS